MILKKYRVIMLVAHVEEIVAVDTQEAHNEATKMAKASTHPDLPYPVISSIEEVCPVQDSLEEYEITSDFPDDAA